MKFIAGQTQKSAASPRTIGADFDIGGMCHDEKHSKKVLRFVTSLVLVSIHGMNLSMIAQPTLVATMILISPGCPISQIKYEVRLWQENFHLTMVADLFGRQKL